MSNNTTRGPACSIREGDTKNTSVGCMNGTVYYYVRCVCYSSITSEEVYLMLHQDCLLLKDKHTMMELEVW